MLLFSQHSTLQLAIITLVSVSWLHVPFDYFPSELAFCFHAKNPYKFDTLLMEGVGTIVVYSTTVVQEHKPANF